MEAYAISGYVSKTRSLGLLLLVPGLIFCLAVSVQAAEEPPGEEGLAYGVQIDGAPSDSLLETLNAISDTIELRGDPPASRAHLRRRVERDKEAFLKALHSQGYYGASLDIQLDDSKHPLLVRFEIDAGPPYALESVSVTAANAREPDAPPLPEPDSLGLQTGRPLRAREVLDAESRLLRAVRELGYPFPTVARREVIVDHATDSATVTFHLDTGRRARFGEARVEGLSSVREGHVRAYLGWTRGDWFKASLLSETQTKLYQTGLFSIVRIKPVDEETDTGHVPVVVDLVEREHRTIAVGLKFYTDTGFETTSRWEHRNIQGLGRKLSFDVEMGQTDQGLGATYVLPFFRRDDQRLIFEAEARREDLDAYLSKRAGGVVALERMLSQRTTGRIGIAYFFDRVTQLDDTENYHLLSLPASIEWTTVEDPLDPAKGTRAIVRAEPFVDVTDLEAHFLKTQGEVSHFIPVGESRDLIVALRTKLGVLVGAERDRIPPDERFYAGGGGSVRGYPYQTISPLVDDDPIGGRSVLEGAVELRRKITETVGFVIFVDGGAVSESSFPEFGSDSFLGAGVGGRYYSPVGPLRLDIAFPLDRRSEIDDSFEIYLSLGQAF